MRHGYGTYSDETGACYCGGWRNGERVSTRFTSVPTSSLLVVVEEGADSSSLCLVCMERPKTMAFAPCGHMCLCAGNH